MPAATRIGDLDVTHCSTPARAQGATTVYVNGIPWSCQGHINTPHLIPNDDPCSIHAAGIATGSTTVFIENKGAGRVGDSVSGCTSVATGSPNVFAG